MDEGRWSWKVMEMGQGTDKDEKGKKGGHTMTAGMAYMDPTDLRQGHSTRNRYPGTGG